MTDEQYMKQALELAERGCGYTSPNPMVGAVIVKENRIIGEGWHKKYGELHAEREALADCKENPEGATMYVTLEPCCHQGKQPPCTEAILEAGIRRVVVGSGDPNPLVSGKGIQILREHGLEVTEHVMEEECNRLNEIFLHYMRTKTPFVTMKYAMTMDGKIATKAGLSKWITSETARNHVQTQRHKHSAIMVGIGTVLADDPMLTCRMPNGKNPIRIICDTNLHTPFHSRIVETAKDVRTILATSCTDGERIKQYRQCGCEILQLERKENHIDLRQLMKRLGEEKIDSILLEGGGTLNWSALKSGIVQKIQAYIAPKLFGGLDAKSPVAGEGILRVENAVKLGNSRMIRLGDDYLIESEVL
ncbi:MAG: bifunctional diaminohydroxyphosphoribosylaminopyrimidine deaminase/5-amino-6-(5-phosphoribosylamino)uracil reductase RibD [Acetatifactor sp.]|nr:bifunctional diaminohydroxyphosphoribosylaminopyrimidine deaminase/5-amino-6-(5-phosphoribosylamino)uracil reductase RibD [Acetatifactor sp.]